MKRDFDRIRELLIILSELPGGRFKPTGGYPAGAQKGADWSEHDHYQISLMWEAGLLRNATLADEDDPPGEFLTISWAGHDYLDAIRDENVWQKTKDGAAQMGGATLTLMKDLAIAFLKKEAAEKLGLELG